MQARRYIVYRDGEKIAEISDRAGPLISAKSPPPAPDAKPTPHPFLSATAYVPDEEGRLRDVLNRSRSLPECLQALRAMGFSVEEAR